MVEIRTRVTADDEAILAIHDETEAESLPLTPESWDCAQSTGSVVLVALFDDKICGYAITEHAWWTGDARAMSFDLRVALHSRRQGVGSVLWNALEDRCRTLHTSTVEIWVRSDSDEGLRFARQRDFEPTGAMIDDFALDIHSSRLEVLESARFRSEAIGIQIHRLDHLLELGDLELQDLYHLWAGTEAPAQLNATISFADWCNTVLYGPGLSPSWHWVATQNGAPVGMTFLKLLPGETAENDYTVVKPNLRGHGIAQTLKVQATDWARQRALTRLYTSCEVDNLPMRVINQRLGYQIGARRVQMRRSLSMVNHSGRR